jgi:pectin methylesterase-like acyl-CoA thioesterase
MTTDTRLGLRNIVAAFGLSTALLLASSTLAGAQGAPALDADPRIQQLIAAISDTRLRQLDTTLVSFGTRETLSVPSPTRGVTAAGQWIFDEMTRSSPKLQVSFDTYRVAPQGRVTRAVDVRNIAAILPGRTERRVYVSGHYDSVNIGTQIAMNTTAGAKSPQDLPDFNHDADAPGANDNGSGTALTMELARVFAESGITFDATLVFVCWAGEEQGLIGSSAHAERLAREQVAVEAVFNNDIVGNSRGGNGVVDTASVKVYSLGPEDSMSRSLARYIARTAAVYVPSHRIRLMAMEDRFRRGSDHSSFNRRGFPAVVFREANEDFARQHSAADTLDGVDFAYLGQNARLNAAGAASLALAPPAPDVAGTNGVPRLARGASGYDADLQWKASPGAVAYRVYWRSAWSLDWEHTQTVGNITQFVLPNVSIDNYVFGVAALGPDGHESLIRAYVAAPRVVDDVKLAK